MKTNLTQYLLTSVKTGNVVLLGYNEQGLLTAVEVQTPCDAHARRGMLTHCPVEEGQLPAWNAPTSGFRVLKVARKVSFEEFYKAYPKKEKRARALPLWDKLPDEDRVAAYVYLERMRMKKATSGEAWPNPDSYLKDRRWED